jgi:hypothetical protein
MAYRTGVEVYRLINTLTLMKGERAEGKYTCIVFYDDMMDEVSLDVERLPYFFLGSSTSIVRNTPRLCKWVIYISDGMVCGIESGCPQLNSTNCIICR